MYFSFHFFYNGFLCYVSHIAVGLYAVLYVFSSCMYQINNFIEQLIEYFS